MRPISLEGSSEKVRKAILVNSRCSVEKREMRGASGNVVDLCMVEGFLRGRWLGRDVVEFAFAE